MANSGVRTSAPEANLAGLRVGGSAPVRIVGVINVSPESFFAGSVARGERALARRAEQMVAAGADVLDIGAMSTAPYRETEVSVDEERERMVRAVRWVRRAVSVPISADTARARVAAAALDAGAAILNDVHGLRRDRAMRDVARYAGGLIAMANEERPGGSGRLGMVRTSLRRSLELADRAGIARAQIVLDPGIGFFRHSRRRWHEVDVTLIAELGALLPLGRPLLVGLSRKSFLGFLTGRDRAEDRLYGSLAATALAVAHGAALVRCHDVAATVDAVRVAEAIRGARAAAVTPSR